MKSYQCLLCKNQSTKHYANHKAREFVSCDSCGVVSVPCEFHISEEAEKERYLSHNNNVNDTGYQLFVTPIVNSIKSNFNASSNGLDFGAGTGPVIAKMLSEIGYSIKLYDPFFHPDTSVLSETYDYIVCCEVMEHFNNPLKEFHLLKSLLNKNGRLICKTSLLPSKDKFANWFYKNDSTHIIFYTPESLEWIKEKVGFSELKIEKDYLIFYN
ncbi:MAG: class I SAM-dependent methyltransferase [Patiriisocius sp.]|uniref:class I SAM-dependent methyltransferase n=1 Tax=Patiriisocius sp. TaxID=2822396 RepID=UPI003EF4BBB0